MIGDRYNALIGKRPGFARTGWWVVFGLLLTVRSAFSQTPSIQASFEPPVITVGEQTSYVVAVEGGDETLAGSLPNVPGLQIDSRAQTSSSSRINIVNGRMERSSTVTYSFAVAALKEGNYTVPAWKAKLGSTTLTVPAATLQVTPPGEEFRDALLLRMIPEIKEVYVGQSTPAAIQLWVRRDVQARLLTQAPNKTGEAFNDPTWPNEASVGQQVWKNAQYQVVTWPFLLTPLKAGPQTISFSVDLSVAMPERQRQARNQRHPFDPFFNDDFFGSMMRQERRTLFTGDLAVEVLPLPTEGRPASFDGAIGQFSLASHPNSRQLAAGEPVTLTVEIAGEGNFDRIAAPTLPETDGWRIYPPKKDFVPEPGGPANRGRLKLEYILIPATEKVPPAPEIRFAYFDPAARAYRELTAPFGPLTILPAPVGAAPPPATSGSPAAPAQSSPAANRPAPAPGSTFLDIGVLPGRWVARSAPPYRQPVFFLVQALAGLSLVGITIWKRRLNRLNSDPSQRWKRQLSTRLRHSLADAQRAAKNGQPEPFYAAARRALQEAVADRTRLRHPETLAWNEVESALRILGQSEENLARMRHFFDTWDALRFGGSVGDASPLPELARQLETLVNGLR